MIAWLLLQIRLFFIALQFFSRIPIPAWVGFDSQWLQASVRYFTWVGVLLAGLITGVFALSSLLWSHPVAVLLSTAFGIWLTGAFHEDGFADMCDGFGGGLTRERVFEIMKDSRLGTYGVVGIGLLLALKCSLLSSLPPLQVMAALLLAHPLSRLAACCLIWRMDYAKEEGKAKPLAQAMSGREFLLALLGAIAPAALMLLAGLLAWRQLLLAILLASLSTWFLARMFARRLGGFTGDCLGATQQLAEVMIYLGVSSQCVYI